MTTHVQLVFCFSPNYTCITFIYVCILGRLYLLSLHTTPQMALYFNCLSLVCSFVSFFKLVPLHPLPFLRLFLKVLFSMTFFSVHLSFLYGKAIDFCKLILYPNTLVKVFISFRSSPVELLGLLMYIIIAFINKYIWILPSDLWIFFSSFCWSS